MGIERIVVTGAELIERAAPGVGTRMLEEVAKDSPTFARTLGIDSSRTAAIAKTITIEDQALAAKASAAKATAHSRFPREMTEAETDAHLDRLLRAMDDGSIGLPPKELMNQGLGARVWQFGTAGGNVFRERGAAEATGKWSPELQASRDWLAKNPDALSKFRALPEGPQLGPVQMVHQGESTQFAAGPLGVGLRTDNVATCAAIYCRDGETQFLGHADAMIHHRALTEALETAGINLDTAHVTLMPGPLKSAVMENILPSFMSNPNAMSKLKIIPFRGPAHGSVIAQDGALFVPKR